MGDGLGEIRPSMEAKWPEPGESGNWCRFWLVCVLSFSGGGDGYKNGDEGGEGLRGRDS